MKRVKFALAGVALVTAALTMSFSSSSNEVKESTQANDCWSTIPRHQANLPADMNQATQCPAGTIPCCVKPNPANPGAYLQFNRN